MIPLHDQHYITGSGEISVARAGRKAKTGRREPNGKLSRKQKARGIVMPDLGTQRTQEKSAIFGTDGSDAIGRAYAMGLLGDHATALRDTARAIHRAYWPMMYAGTTDAAGPDDPAELERFQKREKLLLDTLRAVDAMGRFTRRAFDQLCIDFNPDMGPSWLDRLIGWSGLGADQAQLDAALKALTFIAMPTEQGPGRIQGSNDGATSLNHWLQ